MILITVCEYGSFIHKSTCTAENIFCCDVAHKDDIHSESVKHDKIFY